jgi:hypothetical protein
MMRKSPMRSRSAAKAASAMKKSPAKRSAMKKSPVKKSAMKKSPAKKNGLPPRPKQKGPAMNRYMAMLRSMRKTKGSATKKSAKVKKTSPRRVSRK